MARKAQDGAKLTFRLEPKTVCDATEKLDWSSPTVVCRLEWFDRGNSWPTPKPAPGIDMRVARSGDEGILGSRRGPSHTKVGAFQGERRGKGKLSG